MKNKLKYYWNNKPLKTILVLAFVVRLIAVIFSQGYAFHDDHFLVVEAAQCWVEDQDWNNWMPKVQELRYPDEDPIPQGHSLFYPGVHYVLFSVMDFVGLHNPKAKMFLIRLLHALLSLIIVSLGYKITKHYTNEKYAKQAGLFLALLWFMPFMSVRNLVEYVSIPVLMLGLYQLIKAEGKTNLSKVYFFAGLLLGVAFSIRFQTLVIAGGAGLVLLFRKQWKETFLFGTGVLLAIAIIQGGIDLLVWKRPFAEFTEYVLYNLEHKSAYGHNLWYMYTTVLGGMILPPLGIFLFIGWFLTFKKYPLLFWPSFLFFMFHNYFPNKQERFIIPIIALFVIAGVIGWWSFMDKSKFWNKNKWIFKYSLVLFWILNFIALPIFSTTYSKQSRCEVMNYLGQQEDAKTILVEETIRSSTTMLPVFYAGKDLHFYTFDNDTANVVMKNTEVGEYPGHIAKLHTINAIKEKQWPTPQYIIFINEKSIEGRVSSMKEYFPNMKLAETIYPSYIDMLMRKITPSNNNQLMFVYRTND